MSATPRPQPASMPQYARLEAVAEIAGAAALMLTDAALVYLAFALASAIRGVWLARIDWFAARGELISLETYLFVVPIYLLTFAASGMYTRRVSSMEDAVMTLRACFWATVCALLMASAAHVSQLFSRVVIAMSAVLAAILVPAGRYAVKRALGGWTDWQRPIVLLALNENGLRAAEDLAADPSTGYRLAGVFTERPLERRPAWPVWHVASLDEAIDLCRKRGVRSFILCETPMDQGALQRRFRLLEEFAKEVKIAAADEGMHNWRIESEVLRCSFLLHYQNPLANPVNRVVKRVLDLVAGTALILVFLPALAAIPILIRAKHGRPVLFQHKRIGQGGRVFGLWKFRTMRPDAEQLLPGLLAADPGAAHEFAASCKLRRDPRVTSVGRFLRGASLDELPQLWNVLRGQMSLVGPRPRPVYELNRIGSDQAGFLSVPCGLTGLWQISGRNDMSDHERIRLELFYIRNWSIWLDLVILARTTAYLLRPRGAY